MGKRRRVTRVRVESGCRNEFRQRPTCPFCGAAEPVRNGGTRGNRQFRCSFCGKFFYEKRRNPLTAEGRGCPYCGDVCVKRGFAKNGAQKYRCKGCGRMNTGLRVPREVEKGPFPHLVTLYFDLFAEGRLREYCAGHGVSLARGIRQMLRTVAVRQFPSRPGVAAREPEVTWMAGATLEDARYDSRTKRRGLYRNLPHVYVTLKVTLALDDVARQGMVRTALERRVTHQEAVRWLVRQVRIPGRAAVATLGRKRRGGGDGWED